MKKISIEVEDKVYDVAEALRQSYYEDKARTLEGSNHPMQWVRMAEAAIAEYQRRPPNLMYPRQDKE
jgi:hypothetical protein